VEKRVVRIRNLIVVVLGISFGNSLCDGEDRWGSLRLRFAYGGEPPTQGQLAIDKDVGVFGQSIEDESLVVHAQDRGIANVIVWLEHWRGTPLSVHPDRRMEPPRDVHLTTRGGRFEPHVAVLMKTQRLVLNNADRVTHHPHYASARMAPSGALLAPGGTLEWSMSEAERAPIRVTCGMHAWMRAYFFVNDNPYFAKSDEHGVVDIKDIPVGKHVFRMWHEGTGLITEIPVGISEASDKGRHTILITEQQKDHPDVILKPSWFEPTQGRRDAP
jgi:hypothetical protein